MKQIFEAKLRSYYIPNTIVIHGGR
uniref:Uncharacterized protein n=1 Tax=Arundo donax TaxID=35708 RepID=A0A0A9C9R6_ARUDO